MEVTRWHVASEHEWQSEVESLLGNSAQSRQPKKNRLLGEAAEVVDKMREYASAFDLKHLDFPVIPGSPDELKEWTANKEAREAEAKRRAEASQKREHARLRREYAKDREAWLAGGSPQHYRWYQYFPVELRIVDGEIETSKGASFPLSHAKLALALVESVIKRQAEWATNGHACHLGHYHIDRIAADGTVFAGCHEVRYPAIARIREEILKAA